MNRTVIAFALLASIAPAAAATTSFQAFLDGNLIASGTLPMDNAPTFNVLGELINAGALRDPGIELIGGISSPGNHTLDLEVSETGLGPKVAFAPLISTFFYNGNSDAIYSASTYFDPNNVAFAKTNLLATHQFPSGVFTNSSVIIPIGVDAALSNFSATESLMFNFDGSFGLDTRVMVGIGSVPEPETWALMLVGFFALMLTRRRIA